MNNNDPITKADVQTILDHITSERRNLENSIKNAFKQVHTKLDALHNSVPTEIKDESGLKAEMRKDSSPVGATSV